MKINSSDFNWAQYNSSNKLWANICPKGFFGWPIFMAAYYRPWLGPTSFPGLFPFRFCGVGKGPGIGRSRVHQTPEKPVCHKLEMHDL